MTHINILMELLELGRQTVNILWFGLINPSPNMEIVTHFVLVFHWNSMGCDKYSILFGSALFIPGLSCMVGTL